MTRTHPTLDDPASTDLPATLPDGSSILLATPSGLSEGGLALSVSERYADPGDCRLVLTTEDDAERAIAGHRELVDETGGRLAVVDASESHDPSAPFQEYPTVSLPNPSELTRIVLAMQQLESTLSAECETINVVVQSLSPVIEGSRLEHVSRVVDQLVDRQHATGGTAVFGLEYTRHDADVIAALRDAVDAVIWAEAGDTGPSFEFQRERAW